MSLARHGFAFPQFVDGRVGEASSAAPPAATAGNRAPVPTFSPSLPHPTSDLTPKPPQGDLRSFPRFARDGTTFSPAPMQDPVIPDTSWHCPACGQRSSSLTDTIFVEYGEWDGNAYESEGDVDVYQCADRTCAFAFADVTGIPNDSPALGERAGTTSGSATENHDKGLGLIVSRCARTVPLLHITVSHRHASIHQPHEPPCEVSTRSSS